MIFFSIASAFFSAVCKREKKSTSAQTVICGVGCAEAQKRERKQLLTVIYLFEALLQALKVQLSAGAGLQLSPETLNAIMMLELRLMKPFLHLGSWPRLCHGCGISRRRRRSGNGDAAMG